MARSIKTKPTVAVTAAFVSQLNCTALLGVDPRRYLDVIVPLCKASIIPVGKLRLVPLEVAIEVLRAASSTELGEQTETVDQDRQPESVNGVLAAIGKELAT